jgi:LPS export ABC transporter protein LptC
MQRLARVIPVIVAVFVILVVAILVTRSRTARVESAAPDPHRADLRIKDVEIEEQAGSVRWRLKSDQALVFEHEGRTTLKNVNVVVRDKEREWTIRAGEGDVFQREDKRRDVEVRDQVVVTTDDGVQLETSVLRWDSEGKRLWTDAPVKLVSQGSVVEGKAFDLRIAEDNATVSGRVHATFLPGKRR